MRRRQILRGLAASALGAGGVSGARAAANGPAPWTPPGRPVTVTCWDRVENVKNELLAKKLIPEYQALHPRVTVRYETVAGLWQKLLVALAAGTAPALFSLPDFLLAATLEADALDPVRRRPGARRASRTWRAPTCRACSSP